MLLVNGFKPIQTNYRNQNSNKMSFSQPQLHTKADSVNFTSLFSETDKVAQGQVAVLTHRIGAKYADVLGENFSKVIGNVNSFCASHGLSIKHGKIPVVYYTDALKQLPRNSSRIDLVSASFVNVCDGKTIHRSRLKGGMGLTKNAADIMLYNLAGDRPRDIPILAEEMSLYSFKNPLRFVQLPPELTESTKKVQRALDELQAAWLQVPSGNADSKVEFLRNAYKTLMPEE